MFTGTTNALATEKFRLFVPANSNNVILQASQQGAIMQFNVAGAFFFGGTAQIPRMVITDGAFFGNTGLIGMGNGFLNPQSQLHINDGTFATYLQITNFSTNPIGQGLNPTASDGFKLGIAANGTAELRQQENANMEFFTGNEKRVTITNQGDVQINSLACSNCFVVTDKDGTLHTRENNDSASISNTFVWLTNPLDITGQYGQMSIGKDGKIYIANLWQDSIGVISNPNQYGSQCNILPRSISLGGKLCELGINNFTGSYFYDSTLIPQNCDSTTGVFDNTTSSVFYVYPNPATDQVNIKINNTEKEDIEIKLYDLMTVQKGYYKLSSNTYDATLQLPDIAAGIYIIEFRMGEKNLRQKLCIIR